MCNQHVHLQNVTQQGASYALQKLTKQPCMVTVNAQNQYKNHIQQQ